MSKQRQTRTSEKEATGLISPQPGSQPVTDWAAFLESLPTVATAAMEDLEQAIRENRAERRATESVKA